MVIGFGWILVIVVVVVFGLFGVVGVMVVVLLYNFSILLVLGNVGCLLCFEEFFG